MQDHNERSVVITEMMQTFVQQVSAERVAAYLRHMEDITTDSLRVACASAVESGQQKGIPTVADLRRRAMGPAPGQAGEDDFIAPERRNEVARNRLIARGVRSPSDREIRWEVAQFPVVFGDSASQAAQQEFGVDANLKPLEAP